MVRISLLFTATFCFLLCLLTTGRIFCALMQGSSTCGQTETAATCDTECSLTMDCFADGPSCEKKDCGDDDPCRPSSGGCCVCSPGCCVFLVPDYRFELDPRPGIEFFRRLFGDPTFYPQLFCRSVWHPPATVV